MKRIYHVRVKNGAVTQHQLIRAHSHDQAIRKASEGKFTSELASQDTLVKMLGEGHKIIEAGTEQQDIFAGGNNNGVEADNASA